MNRFLCLGRRAPVILGFFVSTILVFGCGSDGGDDSPTDPGNPVPLSGYVLKGSVEGASVRVHEITATGEVGASVGGPFTTDAEGRWSGEVPTGTNGAYAVTAIGGTYTDESTGSTVSLSSQMRGIVMVGPNAVGNVTPITHAVFENAAFRMQLGATKNVAFTGAIGDMTTALGFNPTTLTPSVGLRASHDLYAVILAGFSALLDANPALGAAFDNAEVWAIVEAVATDLADGKLDGIDILENGIFVDDGTGQGTLLPFPPLDADDISNLVDAANAWAAVNLPGIIVPPIDLSIFGNPTLNPVGDYVVSGTLVLTGPDAELLGGAFNQELGGSPFTPAGVQVELSGSAASGIDAFSFYLDDRSYSIAAFPDPDGTREFASIIALVPGLIWLSPDPSPLEWIPGALLSLVGRTYIVSFTDVVLATNDVDPAIILNGDLRVDKK